MSTRALVQYLVEKAKKNSSSILTFGAITFLMPLAEEYLVEFNYQCPCISKKDCIHDPTWRQACAAIPLVISTLTIFFLGFVAFSAIKCTALEGEKRSSAEGEKGQAHNDANSSKCKQHDIEKCSSEEVQDGEQIQAQKVVEEGSEKCNKKAESGGARRSVKCKDVCFYITEAFILSSAWLAILLIDGDYFACIKTCEAYFNVSCESVGANLKDLPFSDKYLQNKETSRSIGYFIALIPLCLFCLTGCCENRDVQEVSSCWLVSCCNRACCDCCYTFNEAEEKHEIVEIWINDLIKSLPEEMRKIAEKPKYEPSNGKQQNINEQLSPPCGPGAAVGKSGLNANQEQSTV